MIYEKHLLLAILDCNGHLLRIVLESIKHVLFLSQCTASKQKVAHSCLLADRVCELSPILSFILALFECRRLLCVTDLIRIYSCTLFPLDFFAINFADIRTKRKKMRIKPEKTQNNEIHF